MDSKISNSCKAFWHQQFTLRLSTYFIFTVNFTQSTLKHRDTIHMEYEVTLEELSRKKTEKEEVQSHVKLHSYNSLGQYSDQWLVC